MYQTSASPPINSWQQGGHQQRPTLTMLQSGRPDHVDSQNFRYSSHTRAHTCSRAHTRKKRRRRIRHQRTTRSATTAAYAHTLAVPS